MPAKISTSKINATVSDGFVVAFVPRIVKPLRARQRVELTRGRVLKNLRGGAATVLVFDLNILSKINEVEKGEVSLDASGLRRFVKQIAALPTLYISPGFAVLEANPDYLTELKRSYDSFFQKYLPGYADDPDSLDVDEKPDRASNDFQRLPRVEQCLNSLAYLAILEIQIIHHDSPLADGEQKFDSYLDYMSSVADVVGAMEAEVAKYVFYHDESVQDIKFRAFCKAIRKNFRKSGGEKKILERSMNAARDLMYYRLVAQVQDMLIDGRRQDAWFATADQGLFNLSNSIYWSSRIGNQTTKYVAHVRHGEQKKSAYWRYCDGALLDCLATRRENALWANPAWGEQNFDRLLACVASAEKALVDRARSK